MSGLPAPLLGVAGAWGAEEIELHRRFDELHQLIYRRGGLGSSNAAVDELAKLLLAKLWAARTLTEPTEHRAAFAAALRDPSLSARDPVGGVHPVWPVDEPFRLTNPAVLAAADALADEILAAGPGVDALGTAFDALLAGRYEHTGGLGTYLTPGAVARMMADVAIPLVTAAPAGGPGFGDPYCGTGRFLVALLAALPHEHPLRRAGPFGADVSAAAVAKARINLLLYGVPDPLVWTVTDSVTDSSVDRLAAAAPLILTNPPFGEGQYDSPAGIARAAEVLPGIAGRARIDPAVACLARAVSLLAAGGVLGIVLPDGVLRSAPVRALLAGDGPVEPLAVISLPPVTFALSGTAARTSAVFLRRSAADVGNRRRVVLARVQHVGYVTRAGRPVPDPAGNDLPMVAPLVVRALLPDAEPVDVVSDTPLVVVADPAVLDSLDPSRLDPASVAARRSVSDAGGVRLAQYLTAVPARRCRQAAAPFISVLHVDDLGCVDWHAAAVHVPATPGVLAQPGELIVSLLNPANVRAAVIPPGAGVQVSAEFGVFRSTVDPHAVLALLHSPPVRAQLRPLGTGTSSSRRRIGPDAVLALVVPKLDSAVLEDLATTVRSAQQSVAAARIRLHDAYRDLSPERG
jgi:hypothetical protein